MLPVRSVYIGARYGRREEAKELADLLAIRGIQVTSTWLWQTEDEMLYGQGPEVAGAFGDKDEMEVKQADGMVYLSEEENNVWGRGGRHVEYGGALFLGKLMFVIGPQENLFHYNSTERPNKVTHFDSVDSFIAYLDEYDNDEEISGLGYGTGEGLNAFSVMQTKPENEED